MALNRKSKGNYSDKYISMLEYVLRGLLSHSKGGLIYPKSVESYLNQFTCSVSYNSIRRHLSVLVNEARSLGMDSNPMQNIKSIKSKSNLNKPFEDVSAILNEIKAFNYNLYLCCIMTYGCLLRPHREVR